jgi:hypothetical protein
MSSKYYGAIDLGNNLKAPVRLKDILEYGTDRTYTTYFFESKISQINSLCDKYHTDKGGFDPQDKTYPWTSHNYAYFYDDLFSQIRPYVRNLFEFGLGTNNIQYDDNMGVNGSPGASLRLWKDYFPLANIHGADIDTSVLFNEERIYTHYVDQLTPSSFTDLWNNYTETQFDIIIDDGLHTFEAGICTFENSFFKLKPGGIYVIEDIRSSSPTQFLSYFKDRREFNFQIVQLNRTSGDRPDCLVVIRKRYGY